MNKQLILDSLSTLSNSKVGMNAIGSLLSSFAIRGNLNTRCASNCKIENLISELEIQKNRFFEESGRAFSKRNSRNETGSLGFELKSDWGLVSLDKLCLAQAGYAFSAASFNPEGKGLPLIRIRDIDRGYSETFYNGEYRPEFLVHKGDWLIGMDGNFNVRQWKGETSLLNQRVTRLIFFDQRINQKFVTLALEEHLHSLMGTKSYTTVDHLSTKQIESSPIPLPCIEEQDRIISQLEIITLDLNKLDESQESKRRLGLAARKSAVDAIASAQSPKELSVAWERIRNNWEVIADTPESIESLRNLIRELAVRGVITNNNQISHVQSQNQTNNLFDIPNSWRWVKLSEVIDFVNGFAFSSGEYKTSGIGVVRMSDMKSGQIIPDHMKYVSIDRQKSLSEVFQVKPGDIVMGMTGATLGKPCVNRTTKTFLLNQRIGKFIPRNIQPEYLLLVLAYLERSFMSMSFGTGVNNLSTQQIKDSHIPLPPTDEQIQIVKIVSDLFAICEELQTNLINAQVLSTNFARSVVASST